MPSLNQKRLEQAQRLFKSGYTLEQVRKATGIGRHKCEAIRCGKIRNSAGEFVFEKKTGMRIPKRCKGCGGKVYMPCKLCELRRRQAEEKMFKYRPYKFVSEE